MTQQADIIKDFMRRKSIVEDEARKNREEKKAQRVQERASKTKKIMRSRTGEEEEYS